MRFSSLSLVVRSGAVRRPMGVLAAVGMAAMLAACASDSPNNSGARMADDALQTYQVKAALDQDTALNPRQIRIRTSVDGRVILTGWVDTPEMVQRAGEDAKRSLGSDAKVENQLRALSRMQVLGGGPLIPAGLPADAPASAPAAR